MNNDIKKVDAFVRTVRSKLTKRILFNKICLILSVFFMFSSVLNVIFSFFPWIVLPPAWDISIAIAVVIILWQTISILWLRPLKLLDVARLVEKRSGKSHMLLSIALELKFTGSESSFITESFKRAAEQLDTISTKNIVPSYAPMPRVLYSVGLIIWLGTVVLVKPSMIEYWDLPISLLKKPIVTISPGTVRVPGGSRVTFSLTSENSVLPSARLTLLSKGGLQKNMLLLRADSNGTFKYDLDSITESVFYKFSYGGTVFSQESIITVPPPAILGLHLAIEPPSYTGLKTRIINDGRGDMTVTAGAKLTMSILSPELSSAQLVLSGDTLPMVIYNDSAKVSFVVKENATYTFSLTNFFGIHNDSLPVFSIGVISDEKPIVQIVKPGYDKAVAPELQETLWVEAVDDFGIRSMYLHWYTNVTSKSIVSKKRIPLENLSRIEQSEIVWNIKEQSLYPGDTLYYWVQVRDSYPFAVQEGTSDTFTFRLPGFEEIHKSVVDYGEYASEKIAEVKNRQQNILENIESVLKNSEESKELTWEQGQAVSEIKNVMKSQADSLQNALQMLEKSVEKLRQEGVLNDDINKKMDDVRKALEDLIAQFGDSLLNVNKKDLQISTDDMRDAIEKAQEMLPELNERLENTLRFLELLKKDHDRAMLALQSEKLAKEQLDLLENRTSETFLEKQKNLIEKINTFADTLNKRENENSSIKSALSEVNAGNKRMKLETDNGNKPKSQDMSGMSSALLNVAQQLRMNMNSQRQKQMEALRNALLKLTGDLFNLSLWKEQIERDIINSDAQEIALSQQALIESIKKVRKQLDTLAALPPDMHQSLREDFEILEQTSDQVLFAIGGSDAVQSMRFVKRGLENLQNSTLTIIESMSGNGQKNASGGGAGDLMDQLRGLSGKQGALNSAVSELLRSMMSGKKESGGGTQSDEMKSSQERARKDAENVQRGIADQLDKLAKKFKEENSRSEAMSKRIEELEKEAQHLSEMLRNPITPEVSERQEMFLSRMLQAALSMHRREEGKEERKSESAQRVFTKDSKVKSLDDVRDNPDSFYTMRRKAFQGNFPESYRGAIKNYFDSLGVVYLKKNK